MMFVDFFSPNRKAFDSLFLLQHDDNFNMISDPIYTQQLTSPEEFFVRKFDNDINVTSKQLRMEEAELESKLFSLQEPESKRRLQNFTRIRDYLTLCRGGTLVIIIIFVSVFYFRSSAFYHFLHLSA